MITEGDLYLGSFIWLVGALVILWAVWLVLSHKNRCIRRRQRRFHEQYASTITQHRRRRKDD